MIKVFFGKDTGFTNYKVNQFIKKTYSNEQQSQIIKIDCRKQTVSEIVSKCLSYSLFSEKNIILCQDAYFFCDNKKTTDTMFSPKEQKFQDLYDYVSAPNDDCDLIFIVPNKIVNAREDKDKKIKTIIFEILNSNNVEKEPCDIPSVDYFSEIAIAITKKYNSRIDKDAIDELILRSKPPKGKEDKINYSGVEMPSFSMFNNNLQKLLLYTNHIMKQDVKEMISKPLEDNIFEIYSNMLKGNISKAIKIYRDIRTPQLYALNILPTIVNQFTLLALVRYNLDKRMSKDEIASEFNMSVGRTYYIIKDASIFSYLTLLDILNELAEIERNIKINLDDGDVLIELFIAQFYKKYVFRYY